MIEKSILSSRKEKFIIPIFNMLFLLRLSILACLISTYSFSDPINKDEMRKRFYLSVENSDIARAYIAELSKIKNDPDPLVKGYLAATCMVMAKHAFNPYNKLKYFIDGKKELEQTINKSPENIELRVIRFAIQTNAPYFLGYNENIKGDKDFLLKNFSKLNMNYTADQELKKIIFAYLKQSGLCSQKEIEMLSNT